MEYLILPQYIFYLSTWLLSNVIEINLSMYSSFLKHHTIWFLLFVLRKTRIISNVSQHVNIRFWEKTYNNIHTVTHFLSEKKIIHGAQYSGFPSNTPGHPSHWKSCNSRPRSVNAMYRPSHSEPVTACWSINPVYKRYSYSV